MIGRRLIEEELPLKEVNAESAREKSLRHGHIWVFELARGRYATRVRCVISGMAARRRRRGEIAGGS